MPWVLYGLYRASCSINFFQLTDLFSYDLTAAILVYRKSPVGIEFSSHIKTLFCSKKKIGISAGQVSENALLFQT